MDDEARFRRLFEGAYEDLFRFVERRVHPVSAEDVVADVLLVAWRRLDDVPAAPDEARAWLFGVGVHASAPASGHHHRRRRAPSSSEDAQVFAGGAEGTRTPDPTLPVILADPSKCAEVHSRRSDAMCGRPRLSPHSPVRPQLATTLAPRTKVRLHRRRPPTTTTVITSGSINGCDGRPASTSTPRARRLARPPRCSMSSRRVRTSVAMRSSAQ